MTDRPAIPAQPAEGEPAVAATVSAETLELLARRRSTKAMFLTAPGPSPAEVDALIALAARVPDHGKLGPWRFLAIEGEARAAAGAAVATALEGAGERDAARLAFERNLFLRAPVVVAVVSTAAPHPKIPEWEQVLSAGAVCFHLLVAAHAAGWAGTWLTETPTYDPAAAAALGVGAGERIAGLVYLGTASAPAVERARPAPRVSRFQVPA